MPDSRSSANYPSNGQISHAAVADFEADSSLQHVAASPFLYTCICVKVCCAGVIDCVLDQMILLTAERLFIH